jgi:uncharacterized membrane protein
MGEIEIEIVLPQPGYPVLRRWARHNVDVPVYVVISKLMKIAITEGYGSALNCGGMAVSGVELFIGEQIVVEFSSPLFGAAAQNVVHRPRSTWRQVRHRIYR